MPSRINQYYIVVWNAVHANHPILTQRVLYIFTSHGGVFALKQKFFDFGNTRCDRNRFARYGTTLHVIPIDIAFPIGV